MNVESDHGKCFADLASSETSLHLADGTAEHICAAFADHVRALLAAIELYQLASRVDHKGCEVVLDFRLLTRLIALTLSSLLLMHILELSEVLEECGTFSWCNITRGVKEVRQDTAFVERDLIGSLTKVVQDGVNACDYTAGVVQNASLLHVELAGNCEIAFHTVLLLFQELSIDDDGDDRLWDESQ